MTVTDVGGERERVAEEKDDTHFYVVTHCPFRLASA